MAIALSPGPRLDRCDCGLSGASARDRGMSSQARAHERIACDLADVARGLARLARHVGRFVAVLVLDDAVCRLRSLRGDLRDAAGVSTSALPSTNPDPTAEPASPTCRAADSTALRASLFSCSAAGAPIASENLAPRVEVAEAIAPAAQVVYSAAVPDAARSTSAEQHRAHLIERLPRSTWSCR